MQPFEHRSVRYWSKEINGTLTGRRKNFVFFFKQKTAYEIASCLVGSEMCIRDRIQPARPPWWDRQFRELKKLIFSPPSKCPIDLFGPLANRTALKRLHGAFELLASVLGR